MCKMDLLYFFIVVRENEYRENNNIEIHFFLFRTFVLIQKYQKSRQKEFRPLCQSVKRFYQNKETTSGFAKTTKLIGIHSTAASAFCPAYARASWQMVW